jgi:hypothetical protein
LWVSPAICNPSTLVPWQRGLCGRPVIVLCCGPFGTPRDTTKHDDRPAS